MNHSNQQELFYPLKFTPIYKEKIWGGGRFVSVLNKQDAPAELCGESWEVSAVKGDESVVSEGTLSGKSIQDLVNEYKAAFLGGNVFKTFGTEFPLLIKFLDADQDLSIQVHPGDELARARHNSFGKSEMWYIMEAEDEAQLISGFNREMSKESYVRHFDAGTLDGTLNRVTAEAGDVFYIPAGRIHTIGKGLLIAEIQQTSDITYRIYDFDRVDKEGHKRELHTAQAIDAINYDFIENVKTPYTAKSNERSEVVVSPYFVTNVLDFTESKKMKTPSSGSFSIYVCVEGAFNIEAEGVSTSVKKGEVVLLPAAIETFEVEVVSKGRLLETYLPV